MNRTFFLIFQTFRPNSIFWASTLPFLKMRVTSLGNYFLWSLAFSRMDCIMWKPSVKTNEENYFEMSIVVTYYVSLLVRSEKNLDLKRVLLEELLKQISLFVIICAEKSVLRIQCHLFFVIEVKLLSNLMK